MIVHRIYGLVDSDGRIRYVGQTIMPLPMRLTEHMNAAVRGIPKHGGKAAWLMAARPSIVLLEVCERDWREAERDWIGRYTDLFNTQRGGGGGDPRRLRGLPVATEALLGKLPDAILAEQLGVTRKAIAYHRRRRGITASFDRTRNTPPPRNDEALTIALPQECIALLGTRPDYEIARRFGVSKKTIIRRRHAAGLPSYAETTGNDGKIKQGEPHRRWTNRAA